MYKKNDAIALLFGIFIVSVAYFLFFFPPTYRVTMTGVAQGSELMVEATLPIWINRTSAIGLVTSTLDQIDETISTYRNDSELTHWNQRPNTHRLRLSAALSRYFAIGDTLYQASNHQWDGSVLGQPIGWHHIQNRGIYRVKSSPNIAVTFDSIGQGDALEQIVNVLRRHGATRVVVQIGGEVGIWSQDNQQQQVGIAAPNTNYQRFITIIATRNGYISTSGIENHRSKLIDPDSGKPVTGRFTSVIVAANHGAIADGAATAMRLMPDSEWAAFARRLNLQKIWIVNQNNTVQLFEF